MGNTVPKENASLTEKLTYIKKTDIKDLMFLEDYVERECNMSRLLAMGGDANASKSIVALKEALLEKLTQAKLYTEEAHLCKDLAQLYTRMAKDSDELDKEKLQLSKQYIEKAADAYANAGNYVQSGRLLGGLAFTCANTDPASTLDYYERALQYFEHSDDPCTSEYNRTLEKMAYLQADIAQYEQAYIGFRKVGEAYMTSDSLRLVAGRLFYNAILCLLVFDTRRGWLAYDEICQNYPSFSDDRSGKFLSRLREVGEDTNAFKEVVREHNERNLLDDWNVNLLLKLLKGFSELC